MIVSTQQEVYETVYRHLAKLYRHLYFDINKKLTKEDKALISFQTYQEMIMMAQQGYINDYYTRIRRNAI